MAPQTGHIIVDYLHLPPGEPGVLVQVQLVIGAVLRRETHLQKPAGDPGSALDRSDVDLLTHHFEGPQREEGVAALTVGPGVPSRVLALLQDELLAGEVVAIVANPAENRAQTEN